MIISHSKLWTTTVYDCPGGALELVKVEGFLYSYILAWVTCRVNRTHRTITVCSFELWWRVFLFYKNLPVVWLQSTSHDFALLLPSVKTVSENTFNSNTAYLWLSLQTQCQLVRANKQQKGGALILRLRGKITLWSRLLINSSWYDKLTLKHDNGYIETKFFYKYTSFR